MTTTRDIQAVLRDRIIPAGGSRHGLVIGIERYRDERLNLRCARRDAEAMRALMVDPECGLFPPDNVRLLLDEQATTQNVRQALSNLRRTAGQDDTVWIFYAGHADAGDADGAYWVTHDADIDDLYATGVDGGFIARTLDSLAARRLFVFLDCCHAAATAKKNPTRDAASAAALLASFAGAGRVTFAASDGAEKSVELSDVGHGAFTYFLQQGLRGEADQDGDGVVTADELWRYLHQKVTDAARLAGNPQTPILKGEFSHNLALTLNPRLTGQKRRLEEAIRRHVGLDKHELSTDEALWCRDLVLRGPQNDDERAVYDELARLVEGLARIETIRRLVRLARAANFIGSATDEKTNEPRQIPCPACGRSLRVAAKLAGRSVPCPGCKALLEVSADGCGLAVPKAVTMEGAAKPETRRRDGDDYNRLQEKCAADVAEWESCLQEKDSTREYMDRVALNRIMTWKAAADHGIVEGMLLLGDAYFCGTGVSQDYAQSAVWFRRAAEQGCAAAQTELGVCYKKGLGVAQDHAEAVKWLRMAAENGNARGQVVLGVCYEEGVGVAQDPAEAVKWYRKAAGQGYPLAQFNLGRGLMNGRGVLKDPTEAAEWYRKAAEQGHVVAANNLGKCYQYGTGVAQDHAEAVKWLRMTAENGNARGQTGLGFCYSVGQGVEQDYAEAAKWYRKAAEQGDAIGQFLLGQCFENARGVTKDKAEAMKWYSKAAEQGDLDAKRTLRELGWRGWLKDVIDKI